MMRANLIRTVLAPVLGVVLGAGAGAAQANGVLFPYVTTSNTAFTFLTVFENPFSSDGMPSVPRGAATLGFYYGGKPVNSAPNAACSFLPFKVTTGEGVLLQWEAAGRFNLPGSFGDRFGTGVSLANNMLPLNYEGFLLVRYESGQSSSASQIHGEALIVDTATGLTLSYSARNEPSSDFSRGSGSEFVSSWLPRAHATTTWLVLPTGTLSEMVEGGNGGIGSKVTLRTNRMSMGAYERNGEYFSGISVQSLRCFGKFGVDDLSPFHRFPMGGWFSLKTLKPYAADTSTVTGDFQPAVVLKFLQTHELGIPTMSVNEVEAIR